ncbi:DMT family transporter [Rhodococcus sp. NPDC003318]|uniref:DMT family transporter n=1 Tax=Rhodococcus sp. NPDC003318 TaxID=3364503 RepID=UPI0036BC1293
MSDSLLAALLAIGAALCIAVGTVVRQRTAAVVPDETTGVLGPITTLVLSPVWWLGTVVGAAGYALQAAALGLGSLLLVQPLLVLSLLFALPLGARFGGRRIATREWLWAAALTTSVAVLVIVGDPRPGEPRAVTQHWILIALVGLPLVALCLFEANRRTGTARALLLGVAAGSLFGLAAVLTKGVVHLLGRGPLALVTSLELYTLIVVAVVATSLQQSAFQAGSLQASLPASTIMEPVVATLLGFVVLGEYLDADRKAAAVLVVAVGTMITATIALARSSVTGPDVTGPDGPQATVPGGGMSPSRAVDSRDPTG